jgi:hypothetical protein
MVRLSTWAGILGVSAGIWALLTSQALRVGGLCAVGGCPPEGVTAVGGTVAVLAAGLAAASLASFFLQRWVLYASTALSAGVAAGELVLFFQDGGGLAWLAVALAAACAFTGAVASTRSAELSEQVNPLNLPVFG